MLLKTLFHLFVAIEAIAFGFEATFEAEATAIDS